MALATALVVAAPNLAEAQSRSVEIWIRAFIPDPANAGAATDYVVPRPATPGASIVRLRSEGGSLLDACFGTDGRGFSSDASTTARLETRFTLTLDAAGTSGSTTPTSARTRAATTTRVDCATGAATLERQGSVDLDTLGTVSVADGVAQVAGQAAGTNLASPVPAPSIDYSFDFRWQPSTSSLTAQLTYGSFPAFEVYARQPGAAWVTVLQAAPTGPSWTLIDGGTGITLQHQTRTVTVAGLTGRWVSSDTQHRFTLELTGTASVQWTERNESGAQLTRTVAIVEQADGRFRIERPNDAEVLTFLGLQPSVRGEVLARGARASFIVFSAVGSEVHGDWSGLLVIKDANARLQQLVQPGERPPRAFVFARAS